MLETIRAVLSDMDGVLWRGDDPLPGFREFFAFLRTRDLPYALLTNNSSKTVEMYTEKLRNLGAGDVPPEAILTSALAVAGVVADRHPSGTRVFAIGHVGLTRALEDRGFEVVAGGDYGGDAAAVVVGLDRDLTYDKIAVATRLLMSEDVTLYGSNIDVTFPAPGGIVAPGAGACVGVIEIAAGRKAVYGGKPEAPMFAQALERLGTPPAETLMIGDRYETDITGAARAGIRTAGVLTGITGEAAFRAANPAPDLIMPGLPELLAAWEKAEA